MVETVGVGSDAEAVCTEGEAVTLVLLLTVNERVVDQELQALVPEGSLTLARQ